MNIINRKKQRILSFILVFAMALSLFTGVGIDKTYAASSDTRIKQIDFVIHISDELADALAGNGTVPKEYFSGDDYGVLKENIPSWMDIIFYDTKGNIYHNNDIDKIYSGFEIEYEILDSDYAFVTNVGEDTELLMAIGLYIPESSSILFGGEKIQDISGFYTGTTNVYIEKAEEKYKIWGGTEKNHDVDIWVYSEIDHPGEQYKEHCAWIVEIPIGTGKKILEKKEEATPSHNHNWNYTASDNVIKAYCGNTTGADSCEYQGADHAVALTLNTNDMTYTGSIYNGASVIDNISSVTGGTTVTKDDIVYYLSDGTTKTNSSNSGAAGEGKAPVNAGSYKAEVSIGGQTATKAFTIAAKKIKKPVAGTTEFVYNGSQHTYTPEGFDSTVCEITGNTATTVQDSYMATVSLKDKKNTCWEDGTTEDLTYTYDIKRAIQSAAVSMGAYEFGTTPSAPVIDGVKGNPVITYYYYEDGKSDADRKEWKDISTDTLEPGTYHIYAVLSETDNYAGYTTAETTFEVKGAQMPSDIKADGVSKTYNGSSYGIEVKGSLPDGCQIKYGTSEDKCNLYESPKYTNVGTNTVYYEVTKRGYYPVKGSATVTITKKSVTATVKAENKIYNGNTNATVSAGVSNDDLVPGDEITITGLTGTFENQNAGTDKKVTVDSSKAEYAGTGVGNYDIKIGTEAKASIDKLTAEFNWSNTDLTYTGSEQSVTAKVSNAVSKDTFTLDYDGNKQTAVGDYTAKVTALGNGNYKLPEADKAQTAWKISYLAKGTAEVSGTKGDNDWYVTKVTITPEAGYEISVNGTDWTAFLEYDAQGSQTAEYYLKETATDFVSDKKTAEFKIDTGFPTGEIKIKDNGFTEFLNTITFNHFFKNTVDVKITGKDATSGVAKIEYQKVAKGASFDKDGTWTEGKSFSMTANDKSAIYARITDKAGNFAIINSDGIVVYTDATATAEETFTRTSTEDVTTGITVNGNTIASVKVKNAEDESAATTQVDASNYEIKDDKLVLKASYLQTLAAGTYILTVSYNPYGEAYTKDSKGEAPDTSVITLTVKKATGSITDIYDISKVYDGTAVNAPTFTTTNDRGTDDANVTIEYKKQGAEDSTYISEAPQDYGKYVVRITVKSDDDYETVVTTKEFSISKKDMTVSADGYTGTYDGQEHGITVNVTDPKDSTASNVEVTYGTKDADGNISYSNKPVTFKDAGEYTVYYKVSADNYNDAYGSAVVKIAPKTVSLVWSDTEFTYDGKAHKPTAKVNEKDIISPDSVEVTVSGEQTNAGSYTAQAVALSSNNYVLSSDVTASFKINKAEATVTVDNATKHIGKADPKFTYKVTGLAGDDKLDGITILRETGEDAGAYDIMAIANADANPNYDVKCLAGKLTIEDHIKAETPIVENRVEPTCTVEGTYDDVYYCTVDGCKAELERVHQTIPATGHSYGDAVFTWNDDYSTAEATFTCANDKTHVETVKAAVTSETVDPTCETAGKTTYTATVEFNGKTYTDSKETVIGATGHDYADPVFTWNADKATATFTCKNDKTHVLVKDCEVTAESVDATCTTAGKVTYTASVIVAGKTYKDTKVVNGTALGHKYGTPVFTWSDDYSTAEATFTCANDKSHVETVKATVTSETVNPTCETAGKTTYTATAEFEGKTYTDSKETEIKAKGHNWSDWKVTKEATATENGKKESACTVCGIKRYEVIPATGVPTEDPSNGKLEKDVQVAPTAPVQEATMTNTKAEILEAPKIFTEEEKTQIKEGKVDAKIWMEINETNVESIPQETKAQVEKEAEKIMGDQASDIMYFDADLFKQVTNPDTGEAITPKEPIHEPGEHIDVTVKIPEKLLIDETKRSMVREYKIIRIHTDQTTGEDIVDVLDGDFNEETGEFSFATDKFSTYAIAFTDVEIEVSISDNGDSSDITAIGDTKQLTATVTPDSAAKRDVEWTSSDTSVATVDENGVITSVGNGTAVIRATVADSDVYAEYTVKVNVPSKDTPDTPSTPTTPSKPGKPGSTGNPAAPVAKPDTKPVTPKKEEKSSTQKVVKTGDENRTWLFIMMMFAGAGMVVFGRKKKENR